MARESWMDEQAEVPQLDAHVQRLEHFTNSMADGIIDAQELDTQRQAVVEAMKAVEAELSDEQHAKVTKLLVELSAYNIMEVLHQVMGERLRRKFGAD